MINKDMINILWLEVDYCGLKMFTAKFLGAMMQPYCTGGTSRSSCVVSTEYPEVTTHIPLQGNSYSKVTAKILQGKSAV